ncbi:MAG: DinB family protein [Longimicrobiales bacterium]
MSEIPLLLTQLDQAYDRRSWHGTNLRGSIRGVTPAQAVWRPGPRRHNIQEIVVHAAYWKYAVRRRFSGEGRGSFPLKGSNWFTRTSADEAQWRADIRLLEDMHRLLRTAVADLDPTRLNGRAEGGTVSSLALVSGIIAHDLYHAGQIQLLKRLRAG